MDELTNEFIKISNLYKLYCTDAGFRNKKIEIPTFQRLKCWNNDMSKCLISSIYEKYPIGIITTYLHTIDKNTSKLIVIDGLQRINTIVSYLEQPFANKYHADELLNEIDNFSKTNNINKKIISAVFDRYFCKNNFGYSGKTIKNRKDDPIRLALVGLPPSIDNDKSNKLYELLQVLSDKFSDKFPDFLEYNVQIAICHCTEDVLPKIFENLNMNSKKLEANEILAATWQHKPDIIIENPDIIANIDTYYKQVEDIYKNKIRFNQEKQERMDNTKYNCYEYIMGLAPFMINRIDNIDIRNIFYNDNKIIKKQVIFDMITVILSDKCMSKDIPDIITNYNSDELNAFENEVMGAIDFTVKVMKWAYMAYDKMVFSHMSIYNFIVVFRSYFKNKQIIDENSDYYIQLFTLHMFLNKVTSNNINVSIRNISSIPKKCILFMNKISVSSIKDAVVKLHYKNNKSTVPYFFFLLNKYNMNESNHYNISSLSAKNKLSNKSSLWKYIVSSDVISKFNNARLKQCANNIGNIYFSPNVIDYMRDRKDDSVDINDYTNCIINEEFRKNILVKLIDYVDTSNIADILKTIELRTGELINIFIRTFKFLIV